VTTETAYDAKGPVVSADYQRSDTLLGRRGPMIRLRLFNSSGGRLRWSFISFVTED
jgi:hypothetical protein